MAISTGLGLAIAGGAGLLGSAMGGKKGGQTSAQSSQQVTPMERSDEYQTLWDEFMSAYIGKPAEQAFDEKAYLEKYPDVAAIISEKKEPWYSHMGKTAQGHYETYGQEEGREAPYAEIPATGYKSDLETMYDEQREATQPYLESVESAAGTHRGLLDEIVSKRMSGEDVGPYGADIDKLLGERTGISFGGGDPMQFITGSQQRLLGDLFKAQETGLGNIRGTSRERMATDILPAQTRLDKFVPSNIGDIAFKQNLLKMLEPMEMARYHAGQSTSGAATSTASPMQRAQGWMGNINEMLNIASGLKSLFPKTTNTQPTQHDQEIYVT